MLIHALITARINYVYCNSLLFGIPDINIGKLQSLQNSAARLICGTPHYSHILHALHLLPVSFRIVFKIATITFKAIHGMAPWYVHDLVTIRKHELYSLRSTQELSLFLIPPIVKTKKTLDRAYVSTAPSIGTSFQAILSQNNKLLNSRIS